ncbi:hypothetical protein JCM16303_005842 [Sporobolomyces ruberrimus]
MRQLHVVDGLACSDGALEALMVVAVSLSESSKAVVQIGAGVSTKAGIPDFRSSSKGIYSTTSKSPVSTRHTGSSRHSAKELFSYTSLLDPETRSEHFKFMANLHDQCRKFESKGATGSPTIFHDLLRRVDELDKLLRVYSQNVDGFEGDAGLGFVEFDKKGNRPLGENGGKTVKRETGGAQDDSASDYETTSRGRLPRKRRRTSRSPLVGIDSNEWASLPRAQKVVAMHGSLKSVVCSACEWVGDWDDQTQESFTNGDQVECPRCEERAKIRLTASKRRLPLSSLSFLRPDLLLYDDPSANHSSHLSSLSSLSAFDLSSSPDFLLVAGTSLQIPGFKQLVKASAKEVKTNGGICVLVNREPVAAVWDQVFDYEFRMDTDAFATSILSSLKAFFPSTDGPFNVGSFAAAASPAASIDPSTVDSRQTPSPLRSKLPKHPRVPYQQLPTPSPTPSLTQSASLQTSTIFFAPVASTPLRPVTNPSLERKEQVHLPSPPLSSSPLRPHHTPLSRARPIKIERQGPAFFTSELSDEDHDMVESDESDQEGTPLITEEKSRSLVDEFLRQALEHWEEQRQSSRRKL